MVDRGEIRDRAWRLVGDLETVGGAMEDIDSLCTILRQFQSLPFLSGVHLVLKHFSHMFTLHPVLPLLSQLHYKLPDLSLDLALVLITERPEEIRPILPVVLEKVNEYPLSDLRTLAVLTLVLHRFPEADDRVYANVVESDCDNEYLKGKMWDFYYKLAKLRGLQKPIDPNSIVTRFSALEAAFRPQILLDLYWLSRENPENQPISSLFSLYSTVKTILQSLSYHDQYLISSAGLLISLGKQLFILELDPYSVFYHLFCLFDWNSASFFDFFTENELEMIDLMTEFVAEAKASWQKWRKYVYIWHIFTDRKREVDEMMEDFCESVKKGRKRLRWSPVGMISKVRTLIGQNFWE